MAKNFEFLIILIAILISTTTTAAVPPASSSTQENLTHTSLAIAAVLSNLGFEQLSTVADQSLFNTTAPLTIFAPSDNSLLTCPSCSVSLLLQEHSVPGLYPFHLLLSLSFGTKIQTLSPNLRCLTLTFTGLSNTTLFVNGAQITHPNLFQTDLLIVHGLQGFLSPLSPLSCNVEFMTSLSFPPFPPSFTPFFTMRLMLKDAMLRLRVGGYGVLALAMREKYKELIELHAATVFALDDESIFAAGGHAYVQDLRFHIVPNRRLTAVHLVGFPVKTVFPTMKLGEKLVVTTAGGGGLSHPMTINYVKVKNLDLLFNSRIAVHGLAGPFRHIHHDLSAGGILNKSGRAGYMAPNAATVEDDDYHSLG